MNWKYAWFALLVLALGGCAQTYSRNTGTVASVNVSTVTGEKTKGAWPITIDDSIANARRTGFKTSSHVCSAHTLNFDGSTSIRSALQAAAREIFEDVVLAKSATGPNTVQFRLDEFNPRVTCQMGPTEGTCTASAEIGISVLANVEGKRRAFAVNSQRTADGPAGSLCDKVLDVLEEATKKAAKDVAERAGERLATIVDLPRSTAGLPNEESKSAPIPKLVMAPVQTSYVPAAPSEPPAPMPTTSDSRKPCGSMQFPGCRP